MLGEVIRGIMIPFWGTALGAACVFFMRGDLGVRLRRSLMGFAAGIMMAASVWSLLIPSIEQGTPTLVPALSGFWAGTLFIPAADRLLPEGKLRGEPGRRRTAIMIFAVVLHNLPEGMAVGVIYAALAAHSPSVTAAEAAALAIGIAIQNFPEGAIISMPLRAEGMGRGRSFLCGVLSGAVEPVGAFVTIAAASRAVAVLPYLLAFAAGAMVYVVAAEMLTEAGDRASALLFAAGFTVMMALDVLLG